MIRHGVGVRSLLAAGVGVAMWLVGTGGAFAAYEVWVLAQGTTTPLIHGGDTLAADVQPEKIDRAPICGMFPTDGAKASVTLRGGGIDAAGYGTARSADGKRMYATSGSLTGGKFYVFDAVKDVLVTTTSLTATGKDAHGAALAGKHMWVANRKDDNFAVLTPEGRVVGKIDAMGDTPDLLDVVPGVVVLTVANGGKAATHEFVMPIGDQSPESPSDPHGIAVRKTGR